MRRDEDEPTRHLPPRQGDGNRAPTQAVRASARTASGEHRTTNVLMNNGTRARAGGLGAATAPTTAAAGAAAGTEATAEIPVVRATGTKARPPVELEDGTLWYPGVSRRLAAPFGLRLAVWLLFFLLLVGLGGLAVEHYHPGWLSILRKTGPQRAATSPVGGGHASPPAGSTGTGGTTGTTAAGPGLRLAKTTSSGTTYAVAARSYSIVLRFDHDCWTRIAAPAGSSHYLVEGILHASASPKTVRVNGSATVYLGAATKRITIVSGGHTLGVVKTPQVGHDYDFVPSGG